MVVDRKGEKHTTNEGYEKQITVNRFRGSPYKSGARKIRTREQYESLGIKIPKDLIDKEKAFDKEFDLDYELIEFPCTIYEEEIVGFLESKEKTTIYTKNSLAFSVKEKVSEINEKINAFYLQDKR